MEIKILGTGCSKCKTLEEITRKVVKDNGIDDNITKVEDIVEIMKFNIMTTPALVVNEGYNPVCFSSDFTRNEKQQVLDLLRLMGNTFEVPEEKL
jgi:small redox-active disulfide protein 2